MQQTRSEDMLCYSKAISTQNDQFVCKHNKKILSTYPALFIHESQSVLQKLKICFWPHLQRRKHQLEQEEICPQPQNLIAELKTDLWFLSPKSNNPCHTLCFTQGSLNLADYRNAEVYIFATEKKSLNGDLTANLVSTDFPRL